MDFTTNWPKESGHYWFVDTEYPAPQIGFVLGDRLHYGQNEYRREHCRPGRYGIRIGDQIIPPPCTEVRIVE